jgi:predicted esterase
VLAVRSRLGVCSSSDLADWYCWPTSEGAADTDAIRRWSRVVDETQRRVGATRRYLLGFSSGGYFAGMIASQGWAPFDAVVVAHGGPVEPLHPAGSTPPMLLLSADDDVAQMDMMRLDDDLRRVGWPRDSYARAGAHGLADEDIDAALSFFARSGESMPLRPPLPLHRAVFHVHDAGAEAGVADDDAGPLAAPPVGQASDASAPLDDGSQDEL